ncbi:anthranilate synthase [Anaerosporomusa subterranea]|uniref:Anthranilate synthase component 1 n=1 Tax=Anaerosporomusa subterranea TaxID=1794912 RepID=A0A154BPL8_ANASB|nr:anthranilate synthase component I [Anaerosporomusa subterranea]KYZ75851.1 anthranilate synthase [Anaerosporomusa subterranea]
MIPSLEEFSELARQGNLVPLSLVIKADTETPISVYCKLVGEEQGFILESVDGGEHLGRYSFIGLRPFRTVTIRGPVCTITDKHATRKSEENPFTVLRTVMQEFIPVEIAGLPRFSGGAVGYFGFDMVEHLERVPAAERDELGLPDCCLMFPEVVVAFDHVKHTIQLIVCVRIEGDVATHYQQAIGLLQEMKESLAKPLDITAKPACVRSVVTSNRTKEEYMKMVIKAKEYIAAGDIFQVVPSQRLSANLQVPPFAVYRTLRSANPSPYLYYLNFGELQIVGSSPEMLVRLEHGVVETRPIAGTRRRGKTLQEDEQLAAELLADAKERAEHIMLVDLGRNDIGKIAAYGTVQVPTLMAVEKYSHVMHIVSSVSGQLQPGKDAIDALTACFPAGTVSGAPKVRAMEIIRELEQTKRGPYAGAVGYLGFSGSMDTCITIRTFVIADGKIHVQAGGGVVADSSPEAEYEETLNKAQGLLQALFSTEEGIA